MDKASAYTAAIKELKDQEIHSQEVEHHQIKYLNNIVETDHGKLKRLIKPTLGFQSIKTAFATIKGFKLIRMFKRGPMHAWYYRQRIMEKVPFVKRQFGF